MLVTLCYNALTLISILPTKTKSVEAEAKTSFLNDGNAVKDCEWLK